MKKGLFKYFKVVWKEGILAIFFILFETVIVETDIENQAGIARRAEFRLDKG